MKVSPVVMVLFDQMLFGFVQCLFQSVLAYFSWTLLVPIGKIRHGVVLAVVGADVMSAFVVVMLILDADVAA